MKSYRSMAFWTLALTQITLYEWVTWVSPIQASEIEDLSEEKAKQLIKDFSDQTIALLKNKNNDLQKFESILGKFFNLPAIARHIMSGPWKSASDQEKKDYVEAFTHHVAKTYYSILEENYGGQEVKILETEEKGKGSFMVRCEVENAKGHSVSLKVRVQKGKILDMIVENVSTANGLKNQYKEIYREVGKDFRQFIDRLRQKK